MDFLSDIDKKPEEGAHQTGPDDDLSTTVSAFVPESLLGETVGNCRLISVLHCKSASIIYTAQHLTLDRHVVIKLLPSGGKLPPDAINRFEREAKLAAALTHPNIVQTYNAGQVAGYPFIEMEKVSGLNMTEYVAQNGPLSVAQVLDIGKQLADALSYAHAKNIVHRDLKPDNIILCSDGRPKLLDFGVAKALSGGIDLTQTSMLIGTPRYMAPEQCECDPDVDYRADIYALGEVLYFLLTAMPPFSGSHQEVIKRHIKGEYEPLEALHPGLPKKLVLIVNQMMARERSQRPQSAREILEAIKNVESEQFGARRPNRRHLILYATATFAVLVLGATAAFLLRRGSKPIDLDVKIIGQVRDNAGQLRQIQLEQGSALHSGDDLRVTVKPNQKAHVYVFLYGSEGKMRRLFPHSELQVQAANPLDTEQELVIPSRDLWYQLDYTPGVETVFVLASRKPITDVDSLTAHMEEAGRVAAKPSTMARLAENDRGFTGITPGGAADDEDQARIIQAARIAMPLCDTLRTLSFRHLPRKD